MTTSTVATKVDLINRSSASAPRERKINGSKVTLQELHFKTAINPPEPYPMPYKSWQRFKQNIPRKTAHGRENTERKKNIMQRRWGVVLYNLLRSTLYRVKIIQKKKSSKTPEELTCSSMWKTLHREWKTTERANGEKRCLWKAVAFQSLG